MHDQWNSPDPHSLQQAMQFAATPQGQQLMELLRKNGGENLQKAMEKAAAGDLTQAKQALSTLLQNEETKKLLEQLGR